LEKLTTEIMCQIAAMLDEKYHGFYANHPRLIEILAEKHANLTPSQRPHPD